MLCVAPEAADEASPHGRLCPQRGAAVMRAGKDWFAAEWRMARQQRSQYVNPQDDLGEDQRLAPTPRSGPRIVPVL